MIARFVVFILLLVPTFAFAAEAGHGPSVSGLFWRIGVFAVFFAIMFKILRPKIKAGLGSSVERIVKTMNDAKGAYAESEKELADCCTRLASMDRELEQMKQTARVAAEKEAAKLVEEAQKAVIKDKELTARNIAAEIAKTKADLQKEVVLQALAAAEAEISRDSDVNKKQAYIEKSIPNIGQMN